MRYGATRSNASGKYEKARHPSASRRTRTGPLPPVASYRERPFICEGLQRVAPVGRDDQGPSALTVLPQPNSRSRLTSPMRKSEPAMTTGARPPERDIATSTALRVSGSRKIGPLNDGGAAARSSSGEAERL